jgi:methionyl aminopeptidase
MSIETPEQLEGLRRAGAVVAEVLRALQGAVKQGVTTGDLDALAAETMAARGARSGPILTYGYPGSVCLSIDDEVVHGIPGERVLCDGELITLDVALELDGYHADAATTVAVGQADGTARRLVAAARAALQAGIRAARPGATLRDVGAAVQRVTEARGFRVIPELHGHGIGRAMHEAPSVYNWPDPEGTLTLTEGLVFTIEPMIVAGDPEIFVDRDGWTVRTRDHSRSAHEEHTVVVGRDGAQVLTAAP